MANVPMSFVVLFLSLLTTFAAVTCAEDAPEDRGTPPPELDPPIFLEDMTPDTVNNSGDVIFSVRVFDVSGVEKVFVRQWQGSSSNPYNYPMEMVDDDGAESVWNLTLDVPYGSLDPINYYFKAIDRHDNERMTTTKRITVLDDTPPYISGPVYLNPITTGDRYDLRVRAGDLIMLSEVRLFYMFEGVDGGYIDVAMRGFDVSSRGSGVYMYVFEEVPDNITTNLTFHVVARDGSGNIATSDSYIVPVLDNDPPSILDGSPSQVVAGGDMAFKAGVTDNIGVSMVWVTYSLGDGGEPITLELRPDPGSGAMDVTYTSVEVPLPLDRGGSWVNYTIHATDGAGNEGTRAGRRMDVASNSPPQLVEYLSDPDIWTGGTFTVRVSIVDDFGLSDAWVSHSFSGPEDDPASFTWMESDSHTGPLNGTFNCDIGVPIDAPAVMWYRVTCEDVHGQVTLGAWFERRVRDVVPPSLGPDGSDTVVRRGRDFAFRTLAWDNRAVESVRVTYWFGTGPQAVLTLAGEETFTRRIEVAMGARGNLSYVFSVVDSAGNQNSSAKVEVPMANSPPVLGPIPPWTVQERHEGFLDLSGFVSDPDDPIQRLSIWCGGQNVTPDGVLLRALYAEWVPGHWVEVRVSDGANTVTGLIWVVVEDTNEPPTVTISSPMEGSRYLEGEWVHLMASYDDPDLCEGRDLQITWASSLAGTLITFNHSRSPDGPGASLPEGAQFVTVTVSDGELQASDSVLVMVKGDGEGAVQDEGRPLDGPPGYSILVSLLLVIFLGIAAVKIWHRHVGGRVS